MRIILINKLLIHNQYASYNAALRRLPNENQVVDSLRRVEVEPVQMERLSLLEQALILQDAELVIGPMALA